MNRKTFWFLVLFLFSTLASQVQAQIIIGVPTPVNEQVAGTFINSGSLGTGNMTLFARNVSPDAGVAILGEAFGFDATAVFTAFGTGDILRGFQGGTLVFRILNDGGFIASGTKSAVVETRSHGKRLVYSMESPENWFEDFGKARLSNGQALINLDPVFAETVNTENDYHVFLTPKGDCKGLYVVRQNATSFEVRELQGGQSAIDFDYRIVAKRKGHEQARLTAFEDAKQKTQIAKPAE